MRPSTFNFFNLALFDKMFTSLQTGKRVNVDPGGKLVDAEN